MSRVARSWQHFNRNVREVRQLVIVGQEHIAARFDGGRKMQGIGQPVAPWLSRWDCRVAMAAPDSAGPGVHRGGQSQRPQVRPVEKPEEVRKSLAVAGAEQWNQTLCTSQLADREAMAGRSSAVRCLIARC